MSSHRRPRFHALIALTLCTGAVQAQLNDTGQVTCYNATVSTGSVTAAAPAPYEAGFKGQDCTRGRAAADATGQLAKVGASSAPGFDFTKISNSGAVLGPNAPLGLSPTDWGCTRDNVTGLWWEIKTDPPGPNTHLRDKHHTYNWRSTDPAVNGGDSSFTASNHCNSTIPANQCNTEGFVNAVNMASIPLCNHRDWRMPTANELQSIVNWGVASSPAIDSTYFPNTEGGTFYSGERCADPEAIDVGEPGNPLYFNGAWGVDFSTRTVGAYNPGFPQNVRLVRTGGGQ